MWLAFAACYTHTIMNTENPDYLNSSFLDIHLDCKSKNFEKALDTLYSDHFTDAGQRRVVKCQLRVLLLNFIECLKVTPEGFVHYSRNNNYWANETRRMGNPWRISAKLAEVCDILEKAGLAEQKKGSIEPFRLQTRIRPLPEFIQRYIKPYNLLETPVVYHDAFPLVRIKKHSPYYKKGRNATVRKARSRKAKGLESKLRRYNALLEKTNITLDMHEAFPERKKRMYRIFADDKLTIHGRFYGGWWQHDIKSDQRKYILINGNRTVECDYKAQHPHMIYAILQDTHMSEFMLPDKNDPYVLPKEDGSGNYPRGLVKDAFLCCMNAKGREATYRALTGQYKETLDDPYTHETKKAEARNKLALIGNRDDFKSFIGTLSTTHSAISGQFYGDWWKVLLYLDSQICEYVLDTMTRKGIPALSIHDSFIVEEQHEDTLKAVMENAYTATGHPKALPPIKTIRREDNNKKQPKRELST